VSARGAGRGDAPREGSANRAGPRPGSVGSTEAALRGHPTLVRLAILLLATVGLTGCFVEPPAAWTAPEAPLPPPEVLVERQLTVSPEEAPPPAAGAAPAPLLPRIVPPDPVPFEIGAGYGALSRVDLSPCAARGLPPGYLHVRAEFTGDGYVVRASVSSPTAPPPSALDCIADQLRLIGVPAFDGVDARLSRTFFVTPGAVARGDTVM